MNVKENDKLARQLENRLRRSFIEMVRSLRTENTVQELEAKIARGDLMNLIEGVDVAAEKFSTDVTAGYVRAGQKAARELNELVPRPVKFNFVTDEAADWIEGTQDRLVRHFMADQQELARVVVTNGRARGLSDRRIAEEVRAAIGMNATQYEHVASYRRALESGNYRNAINRQLADSRSNRALLAAEDAGKFIPEQRIDAMTNRYIDKWIKMRAVTISIHESTGATHAGIQELYEQAVENGDVPETSIDRIWVTRGDHKVRGTHKPMHNQRRPLNKPFRSGAGVLLDYPGDDTAPLEETARCRCRLRFVYRKRQRA